MGMRATLAIGLLLAASLGFVPPIERDTSHTVRALLAVAAIGLAWSWPALALRFGPDLRRAALGGLCILGMANYWQFDRSVAMGPGDVTDVTYYYLNAKYFDELGYDQLYNAMLVADDGVATSHITQIRNLATDELESRDVAEAHGQVHVARAFTPERWHAFEHDVRFFLRRLSKRALAENFFVDHGYNPPLPWAVAGASIASWVPVESLGWATYIDVALLAGAFALVGRAYGVDIALWAVLFFATTFSGRWPILGQSLLRFDWSAALLAAMAASRLGRPAMSGSLLAFAAMTRAFPALFAFPWLVAGLRAIGRDRHQLRVGWATLGGAVATVTALGVVSLVWWGADAMWASVDALALHARSFSSQRIGLGTVVLWRGETTREALRAVGGMAEREQDYLDVLPYLRVLGLGIVVWLGAVMARRGRPPEDDAALMVIPFFAATVAQANYYNLRLVPVVWHASRLDERLHRGLLALLFAVEVVAHTAQVSGLDRHATNALSSWGILLWCVAVGASLVMTPLEPPPTGASGPR